jgi:hypothetical protein
MVGPFDCGYLIVEGRFDLKMNGGELMLLMSMEARLIEGKESWVLRVILEGRKRLDCLKDEGVQRVVNLYQ